jgi:protease PrsW
MSVLVLTAFLHIGLLNDAPADANGVFFLALAMSSLLAVVPVSILWRLERRERASMWFFAAAFLWGGFVATALAVPFNSAFFQLVDDWVAHHPLISQLLGTDAAELISAPISAPIVEELAKALGVILIFVFLRGEFHSVRDGIVYGALVGVGFNWYEAALYVAKSYAEFGVAPYGYELGGRYALLGLGGHVIFTGIFGGFLGYSLVEQRWALRIAAPIVGLMLACSAHMLNNVLPLLFTLAEAAAGIHHTGNEPPPDIGFSQALLGSSIREALLFLPFVMVAALVLWRSDVWERRLIRDELNAEVGDAVSEAEYNDIITDPPLRTLRMDRLNDKTAAALVNAQNELAFRKHWLRDKGKDLESDAIVARLRDEIRRLHAAGA